MSRILLAILVLALGASGLSVHAQEVSTVQYAAGFAMTVPDGWEVLRDIGAMRMIVRAPSEGPADTFLENVNVVIDGLPATMTTEAWDALNRSQMQTMLPGFIAGDTSFVEIGERSVRQIAYGYQQGGRTLRGLSYTLLVADRAYILTATATEEAFEKFEPTFQAVIESFRLN